MKSTLSIALSLVSLLSSAVAGDKNPPVQNVPFNARAEREAAGDQPDDPGPPPAFNKT
jgi:opacity protein-like surface antigen